MTLSIIHSGRLPLSRKASTTLSRLASFFRFASLVAARTSNLRLNDLDAALLAHDPAVLHALVLAAVALVVLHWSEDLRAEEPVALRLEGSVVDGLGLLHLAVRPLADLLRRGERDSDGGKGKRILGFLEETEDVTHGSLLLRSGLIDRCVAGFHQLDV